MEEMNMKKHLFILMVACAAVVACNKNESPVEAPSESNPVKMTLTATIGADTKVSYVDEGNVLKTAWEKDDKVSLLALDGQNRLLSNDIFEAKSSGKTVDFSGMYANHKDAVKVYVYYPALTEGEGTREKPFMSAPPAGGQCGLIYDLSLREHDTNPGLPESMFSHLLDWYYLQNDNADPSHLAQCAFMKGLAEMDGDTFEVTLDHMSYIIKAVFTLPENGYDVKKSVITSYDKNGTGVNISATDWQYVYEEPSNHNLDYTLELSFGDEITNWGNGTGSGFTLAGNTVTAYFVGFGEREMAEGNYWEISLTAYLGGEYTHLVGKKTFTSAKTLEPGKMYRLSATLEKEL